MNLKLALWIVTILSLFTHIVLSDSDFFLFLEIGVFYFGQRRWGKGFDTACCTMLSFFSRAEVIKLAFFSLLVYESSFICIDVKCLSIMEAYMPIDIVSKCCCIRMTH